MSWTFNFCLKKKKKSKIVSLASAKLDTVAIRFPKHKVIRSILKLIDFPLAMPSANLSSGLSPVNAYDVFEEFQKKIKIIINGGSSKIGIESTVIDLTGKPKVLRPGIISEKEIKKVFKTKLGNKKSKIRSPGMLKKHYSPGIPVIIGRKPINRKYAYIVFGKKYKNNKNYFNLSKKGDLKEAAANLYKTMRKIKKKGYKKIFVSKIPNQGPGLAINDRLKRASKLMFIKINNLSKIYNQYLAVNKINFQIEKNKTVGLLGPNGCGKTTTIGMMLGLVSPTEGEILIENKNINKFKRDEILKRFNFASPYVELPKKLTVKQNLEIYGRLYGIKDLNNRINEISSDLDIKNFFERKTGELSSGQKNRVSLAKSLINKPEILLLDEPTASLDPDIGDFIRSYIEEYKSKNKITILLASHNMSEVERLCDSIIMMRKGKIIDKGTCQDLIKKHGRNNLEETFLKLARSKNEF